jgi:hypothetical protein
LGKPGTNECSDPEHKEILQESMCKIAAQEAGATVHEQSWRVDRYNQDNKPNGCFTERCGHGKDGAFIACYFFNPLGDQPTGNISAEVPLPTKVCSRTKHKFGTEGTNGEGADCPAGYQVVMDENVCRDIAGCAGEAHGNDFKHGIESTNSMHELFPEGCFKQGQKVFFNPTVAGYGKPKGFASQNGKLDGTPICNVSVVTRCVDDKCSGFTVSANATKSAAGEEFNKHQVIPNATEETTDESDATEEHLARGDHVEKTETNGTSAASGAATGKATAGTTATNDTATTGANATAATTGGNTTGATGTTA